MSTKIKQKKRWGKKFVDKRDHKAYQAEFLRRYEIYLDLDWVDLWDDELAEMNKGKRGKPYEYPKSMIEFQSLLVEKFSLRGAESFTRQLQRHNLLLRCNDHSTIHRRVIVLDIQFEIPKGNSLHIGHDGSGMKMTNAGEYFQSTYMKGSRKRAHLMITATKDDIIDVEVVVYEKGMQSETDTAILHTKKIIEKGGKVEKTYDDAGYDAKKYFNFLEEKNIKSAVRTRRDKCTNANGSMRRKHEKLRLSELGYKKWAEEKNYGYRWVLTEGHFSAIKRVFGDNARAKRVRNILIEHRRKVWIYDKIRKYGRKERNWDGEEIRKFYLCDTALLTIP
jgi:hypothetical protein